MVNELNKGHPSKNINRQEARVTYDEFIGTLAGVAVFIPVKSTILRFLHFDRIKIASFDILLEFDRSIIVSDMYEDMAMDLIAWLVIWVF
jgi:hypothetical protein